MLATDTIYWGDAIDLLNGASEGRVDLVFADPPFNIGYLYDNYVDDRPNAEYIEWTRRWMAACQRVLKADGSFYIAIGDDFAADVRVIGRELGLHLRNWIIWRYTFGQNMKAKFCRAHTHVFYFTKDARRFTFNDGQLRFPSARHTEYQDLRASPLGRLPDDVWDEFPRVCGTFRERAGFHGCQMPEALLMRIIMASSNPGEIVLDPFVGSGTAAAAAKRLGRRYIGIDISEEYVKHTRARLAALADESRARPENGRWPTLHTDLLLQIYRETKVSLPKLLANDVAMRVVAASLSARAGHAYSVAGVQAEFERISSSGMLPKLPNDMCFAPREHRTSQGKRYVRKTLRVRARRHGNRQARPRVRRAI